jgi:hypothetical protein
LPKSSKNQDNGKEGRQVGLDTCIGIFNHLSQTAKLGIG